MAWFSPKTGVCGGVKNSNGLTSTLPKYRHIIGALRISNGLTIPALFQLSHEKGARFPHPSIGKPTPSNKLAILAEIRRLTTPFSPIHQICLVLRPLTGEIEVLTEQFLSQPSSLQMPSRNTAVLVSVAACKSWMDLMILVDCFFIFVSKKKKAILVVAYGSPNRFLHAP